MQVFRRNGKDGENGMHDDKDIEGRVRGRTRSTSKTWATHASIAVRTANYADPYPLASLSFGTTMLSLALFYLKTQGIEIPNAVLTFSVFFGGLTQYLAGLWAFVRGDTFAATTSVCYGMFWWGFSIIYIPFFGEMGSYDGQPGVYSVGGLAASETNNALGLFFWVWFGVTSIFTLASAQISIAHFSFFFSLDLTFIMLGAFYYTQNRKLETAAGAFGVLTAFLAYYLAVSTFLKPSIFFFPLPLGSMAGNKAK